MKKYYLVNPSMKVINWITVFLRIFLFKHLQSFINHVREQDSRMIIIYQVRFHSSQSEDQVWIKFG